MIGEPIISVIMVTIGLSTVFQAALKWMFGVNPQPFPRVFQNASVDLFGLQIQTVYVMSLIVSVPNRPGAVHDLLVPLKQHGVSMTRFESRPARQGLWEYYFYIDVIGHRLDPPVAAALADIREEVVETSALVAWR